LRALDTKFFKTCLELGQQLWKKLARRATIEQQTSNVDATIFYPTELMRFTPPQ
jgi:hypothetical protein